MRLVQRVDRYLYWSEDLKGDYVMLYLVVLLLVVCVVYLVYAIINPERFSG
jgi:hypothetical protein